MAAISSTPRRRGGPPAWVGTVGMGLGTVLGVTGCYLMAHFL